MSDLDFFNIVKKKETNLVLSLDVTNKKDFFTILKQCAPYICALKLHIELNSFLKGKTLKKLICYSKKYEFIIIEDRKFADIGNTQHLQAQELIKKGITHFTSHCITGKKALESFPSEAKLFLISDMSCEDSFFSDIIDLRPIMHKKSKEYFYNIPQVIGFISQYSIFTHPQSIILRPGIRLHNTIKKDSKGQNYNKPTLSPGICWVVGRDIYQAKNPQKVAQQYRELFKKNKKQWFINPTNTSYV